MRYTMEKIIALRHGLDEQTITRFLSLTKLYVEQEDTYAAWIAYVHHYSGRISKSNCKKWFFNYMKAKHPDIKVKDESKYLSIMI